MMRMALRRRRRMNASMNRVTTLIAVARCFSILKALIVLFFRNTPWMNAAASARTPSSSRCSASRLASWATTSSESSTSSSRSANMVPKTPIIPLELLLACRPGVPSPSRSSTILDSRLSRDFSCASRWMASTVLKSAPAAKRFKCSLGETFTSLSSSSTSSKARINFANFTSLARFCRQAHAYVCATPSAAKTKSLIRPKTPAWSTCRFVTAEPGSNASEARFAKIISPAR
mmetsp:Transcript_51214/g.132955  ORF Transcript_51214/g.132955 Transcript_51214/m.132955 type:complete len:232 (+) Transcript_51214:1878-2573(+)